MKLKKSALILIAILALAPLVLVSVVYARLPDTVPMQWGFNGSVRYDPKINLWMMTALSPLMAALFLVIPKIDPKRRNYQKFGTAYQGFIIVLLLFLFILDGIVVSESFYPGRISVYTVVMVGVGLLFVFLGNMMPKVKSNFYVGARTPWTLSDPDVWFKTNRLCGYLFFFSGLLLCLCPFILPESASFVIILGAAGITVIVPSVMSYIWYQQKHHDETD